MLESDFISEIRYPRSFLVCKVLGYPEKYDHSKNACLLLFSDDSPHGKVKRIHKLFELINKFRKFN